MCNINQNYMGVIVVVSFVAALLFAMFRNTLVEEDHQLKKHCLLQEWDRKQETFKRKYEADKQKNAEDLTIMRRDIFEKLNILETTMRLMKLDKTGKVDYAYGGRATPSRGTETFVVEGTALFGIRLNCGPDLSKRILEESVMPGQCWPIKGQRGSAEILLTVPIVVTEVTLEYPHVEIMDDKSLSSAPREFVLLGLADGDGNEYQQPHVFGTFEFDPFSSLQTFLVQRPSQIRFQTVEFIVNSNNGHSDFTCIYRVRVHGHL